MPLKGGRVQAGGRIEIENFGFEIGAHFKRAGETPALRKWGCGLKRS